MAHQFSAFLHGVFSRQQSFFRVRPQWPLPMRNCFLRQLAELGDLINQFSARPVPKFGGRHFCHFGLLLAICGLLDSYVVSHNFRNLVRGCKWHTGVIAIIPNGPI